MLPPSLSRIARGASLMLLRGSVIYDDPAPCRRALSPGVLRIQLREHIGS
jgi:hypothetical protein